MTPSRLLILFLLIVHPVLAETPQSDRTLIEITGDFGNGWSQEIGPFDVSYPNETIYKLSVEDGWLHVTRSSTSDEFGWHIVLGRTTEPPEIATVAQTASFEISICDGRYFIREAGQLVRVVRERKTKERMLHTEDLFDDTFESKGWGKTETVNLLVSSWSDGDWFFVASGNDEKHFDVALRLNHASRNKGGYGVHTYKAGVVEFSHGDTWYIDDGELLVASRLPLAFYRAMEAKEQKLQAAKSALEAGDLPPLQVAEWLNTEEELNWENLRGKVVLLDFWSTTCGPCIASFPEVQQLHDEFGSQGLVVIAVHQASGETSCKEYFAENDYTFPVAIDSGETAESYAISMQPTYFLFDRDSKLVQGFDSKLPDRELIQKLLDR